jgi:hypothetical protein
VKIKGQVEVQKNMDNSSYLFIGGLMVIALGLFFMVYTMRQNNDNAPSAPSYHETVILHPPVAQYGYGHGRYYRGFGYHRGPRHVWRGGMHHGGGMHRGGGHMH